MNARISAQKVDSALLKLQQLPTKYITNIDQKVTLYSSRITSKTERTLAKLSRWENKIKSLLQRANPQAAEQLFGNNQPTFSSLLILVRQGQSIALKAQAPYNQYRDELTSSLAYISRQKEGLDSSIIRKASLASSKMEQLNLEENNNEAVQQFIQKRKKQLIIQALQTAGSSRYLTKISKESYYYTETLKNYKELFSDSKKAEQTGKELLNKIPAFHQFVQKNSMLAAIFGQGASSSSPIGQASLAGLQTRASVQSLIQDRILSGGPNAAQSFQSNISQAQAELGKLKEKLSNAVPGTSSDEGEVNFRPNQEKTKTFGQRLEYGTNLQFAKNNTLMPGTADIGLNIGFRLSEKTVFGVGGSYKLSMGTISKIRFSGQGASIRSYADWKLHKQFFLSGGYEMNYLKNPLPTFLQPVQNWQRSALAGISKKISIKTKWFKETKLQLLYDFLCNEHVPLSQPLLFRVGYSF